MIVEINFDIEDKVFFIDNRKITTGTVKDFILYGSKKEIILNYIILVYENKHSYKLEIGSEFIFKTKNDLKKSL